MPPPDLPPVVYVETNWLVALVLPHERLHETALELLRDANDGACEVRIPYASFLEANDCIEKQMIDHPRDLERIRKLLLQAIHNGVDDLRPAVREIESPELRAYFQRPTGPLLSALEQNPNLVKLHDADAELETMRRLRPQLGFTAKDRFDLY